MLERVLLTVSSFERSITWNFLEDLNFNLDFVFDYCEFRTMAAPEVDFKQKKLDGSAQISYCKLIANKLPISKIDRQIIHRDGN